MSFYKRRCNHARNLWEEQTIQIEHRLQQIVDEQLLQLQSYLFELDQSVQLSTTEIGTVVDRSVTRTRQNNIATKYTVEIQTTPAHTTFKTYRQEDLVPPKYLLGSKQLLACLTNQNNGSKTKHICSVTAREACLNQANQVEYIYAVVNHQNQQTVDNVKEKELLLIPYQFHIGQPVRLVVLESSNTNDTKTDADAQYTIIERKARISKNNHLKITYTILDVVDHPNPLTRRVKQEALAPTTLTSATTTPASAASSTCTFFKFPILTQINSESKEIATELMTIHAMSSKSTSRKMLQLCELSEGVAGSIGETTYLADETVTTQVTLHTFLHQCMKHPTTLFGTQMGVDMQCNVDMQRRRGPPTGAATTAAISVPEAIDVTATLAVKTAILPVQTVTARAVVTDEVPRVGTPTEPIDTVETLELRPPPNGTWMWPCLTSRRLQIHLDVFVNNGVNGGGVDGNHMNDGADERSFSTEISVDKPILSILHYLKCWYLFQEQEEQDQPNTKQEKKQEKKQGKQQNTPSTANYTTGMDSSGNTFNNTIAPQERTYVGDNIELFINIRTHASEHVIRVDTMNCSTNLVVSKRFAAAWDLQHKSGSIDTGLVITVSAICRQMYPIPALCVSLRVADRDVSFVGVDVWILWILWMFVFCFWAWLRDPKLTPCVKLFPLFSLCSLIHWYA